MVAKKLPDFLFHNISNDSNACHASLVEALALIDQSLYQDFLGSDPSPLPWGKTTPEGWHLETPSSKGAPGTGFGFPTGEPLQFAVPDGFSILNITHNGEGRGAGHGYDGLALFNAQSGVLLIADKGLDQSDSGQFSTPDWKAVSSDGEYQVHQAVNFLEGCLQMVKNQTGHAPSHVLLTGHSLGGPLATAQAIALAERHPKQSFEVVTFESIGSDKLVNDAVSGAFDILGNHQHVTSAVLQDVQDHSVAFTFDHSPMHLFGHDLGLQVLLNGTGHDMEVVTPAIQALVSAHHSQDVAYHSFNHQSALSVGHSWLLP